MDGAVAKIASSFAMPSPIAAYRPIAGSRRSGSSSGTMPVTGRPISTNRECQGHGIGSPRCRDGSSTCSVSCAWSGGSRTAKRSSSAPDPHLTPGPDPASSQSAGRGPWPVGARRNLRPVGPCCPRQPRAAGFPLRGASRPFSRPRSGSGGQGRGNGASSPCPRDQETPHVRQLHRPVERPRSLRP